MKIVFLILLLITSSIFPGSWISFPFFIAYCLPLKYAKGFKRYLNIGFNILIVISVIYVNIYIFSNYLPSNSKIIYYPKIYKLIDFFLYLPLSICLLLFLKYVYKYSIIWIDFFLHLLILLFINYFSEPLAVLIIEREHFRAFTMSVHLLFAFYSLYCIWKIDQHEKKIIQKLYNPF